MKKDIIDNRISKIINFLNVEEPIDIVNLTNVFGLKVIEDKNIIPYGVLTINKEVGNIIYVKEYLSVEMKRYVISYLLSYYLLYYNNSSKFFKCFIPNEELAEVSYMARKLLLNEKIFSSKYYELNENIEKLSLLFTVPRDVISKRIDDIKPKCIKKLINN